MTLLEITVQRKAGETWPVVVEHSRPDSISPIRTESELRLSDDDFSQFIQREIDPRGYGKVLGRALFSGLTREAFLKARARDPEGLRVLLFVEDKALQRLYWGRLCAPVEEDWWDFLLLDQRAAFSLFLPSTTGRTYRPIGSRDLRALLLVAKPDGLDEYGLDDFDAPATVGSLRRALDPIPCDVLAAVPGADGLPTLDELSCRLTEGQDTILHVVAHGQVKGDETYLYLANSENKVERVAGEALIRELRRVERLPHLVFLATCHSAQPKAGLGGLAQRLVSQLGMPAAVAMSESVSIDTAEALATTFYRELRIDGRPDTALAKACAGLTRRHDVTAPGLYSRLGGRPLFSDESDRELTDNEIEFGLTEFEALMPKRAPVLQEEFSKHAGRLRGMLGAGRENLSKAACDEWDQELVWMNAMSEEVLDLSFPALALGKEPPHYDDRCPFPGLLAFGSRFAASGKSKDDDREFFFGRDELVKQLVKKLQAHPFLAVLGGSGSGKSSLVLAGLVPALKKKHPTLRMAYMTPGGDPHARLDAALGTDTSTGQPVPPDPRPPSGVGPLSCILVVDQFEELFRLTRDPNTRQTFVQRLLALTNQHSVVLTMRADFWGDCFPYPALRDAMLAHQVPIAPMTSAELRSAMEQQAAAVGLRFEADLSNMILDAVEGEPGAMPLLQHLLLQMWKRRHGRWLRASEYRALGGIKRAIAHTADRIYAALSPAEQATVRNIFVRLTRVDEEAILGQERRDTRRRIPLAGLVPVGGDRELVRQLVHWLAGSDARLVVTSLSPTTDQEEVEVAHEALIRYWPSLRDWLEQDRVALRQLQMLGQAAEDWERGGRSPTLLIHQGERLRAAARLAEHAPYPPNDLEATYLEACLAVEASPEIADLAIHIQGREEAGYPVEIAVDGKDLARSYLAPAILPWASSASARADGARLFHYLVSNSELYDAWVSTRYRRPNRRIRLWIDDAATELDTIPWELLHDPGRSVPAQDLGGIAATPFCRYLPGRWLPGAPVIHRPIRVLAVIASPADLRPEDTVAPPDSTAELTAIQSAVAGLEVEVTPFPGDKPVNRNLESSEDRSVQSSARGKSDRSNFPVSYLAELQKGYHIFHVIGHGVIREGKATLLLADEENCSVPVSAQELAKALTGLLTDPDTPLADRLRLTMLSVPQNAPETSATVRAFCDLARELVTAGVPAVLIVPQLMTPDAFQQFVGTFYRQLLTHGQVDLAANQARATLLTTGADQSQLPMLFTRLRDGLLLGRGVHVSAKQVSFWPYLLHSIETGSFTPILGPGINAGLLPEAEIVANEIATKNNLPEPGRADLAQVLEFLASRDVNLMRHEYLDALQRGLYRCLDLKRTDKQRELGRAGLGETAAMLDWAERVRNIHEAEIHHLLADLPLPLYVTTNVDNFMMLALEAKLGRHVRRHVINWRQDVQRLSPLLNPPPSPQDPVVLCLFGADDQPDSMVLTADDQLDWIARIYNNLDYLFPANILSRLASTSLLILGYQQDDLALNVLQRGLLSRLTLDRWGRRHVIVHSEEAESPGQQASDYLTRFFAQNALDKYWGTAQQFVLELWTHWKEYSGD